MQRRFERCVQIQDTDRFLLCPAQNAIIQATLFVARSELTRANTVRRERRTSNWMAGSLLAARRE